LVIAKNIERPVILLFKKFKDFIFVRESRNATTRTTD
jgi:hypothetical protein